VKNIIAGLFNGDDAYYRRIAKAAIYALTSKQPE